MTTMWPEGQYQGYLVRAEAVIAQTGTRGIELTFEVQGREVRSTIWISEKSLDIAEGTMRSLGWNGEFDESMRFDPGGPVLLRCEHEEYKGQLRERWSVARQRSAVGRDDPIFARLQAQYRARGGGAAPMVNPKGSDSPHGGSPTTPAPPASAPPSLAPPKGQVAYGDWSDFSFPDQKKQSAASSATSASADDIAPPPPPTLVDEPWTKERAWKTWVSRGCKDGDAFWAAARRAGIAGDNGTSEQWREVAFAAPPF